MDSANNQPGMMAAAQGRVSSLKWRIFQNLLFCVATGLVLQDFLLSLVWFTAMNIGMMADAFLARMYQTEPVVERRQIMLYSFVVACFVTVTIFCSMVLYLGIHAGPIGQILAVLMAISSLYSISLYLFQARHFMAVIAIPAVFSLCALPFLATASTSVNPVAAAIGLTIGVVAFLAYAVRAAFGNARIMKELIDARAQAERGWREAEAGRDAAEAAARAKSLFMAKMSHELRTPLNAVIGYAEILEEDLLDPSWLASEEDRHVAADDSKHIQRAAKRLLGMINQVLDLNALDTSRTTLHVVDAQVAEIMRANKEALAAAAAKKGLRVGLDLDVDLTTWRTDDGLLRECLDVLTANALKFTDQGHIQLSARIVYSAGRSQLAISVADTGVGMDTHRIEQLFRPFEQLDNTYTRAHEGAGLGLAILKKKANLLGAEIQVESARGKGSKFTLLLPELPDDGSPATTIVETSKESVVVVH